MENKERFEDHRTFVTSDPTHKTWAEGHIMYWLHKQGKLSNYSDKAGEMLNTYLKQRATGQLADSTWGTFYSFVQRELA